ncbi:entry exclusion lipoprotein TrbK [Duganella sp. CY15W]|uniref:entry exclusion lipoprotein TrbK n=1 Tax=Duganella sp. CY15W TaxID=2692172 RepID=UPI00136C63D2|nr:entry exclusion lipoprotein TrbK [Duganella sp. CY15W]MYM31246.1 entry exclusion lipoprotein TrbK [Duganella sp. CY15W]
MQTKFNWILLACAAAALVVTGYKEMHAKPQPHLVNEASCTPEAIKRIDSITERAIQSSQCAQRAK